MKYGGSIEDREGGVDGMRYDMTYQRNKHHDRYVSIIADHQL